jgi:hypothetical protein
VHRCYIRWVPHVRSEFQEQRFSAVKYHLGIRDRHKLALHATRHGSADRFVLPQQHGGHPYYQCSTLDSKINAEMLQRLDVSCSPDLEQRTIFDVTTMVRYLGPHMSKYAQTTDKNVDYHVYSSGKQVIKAFIANDFQFINANGQVITELSDASIEVVDRVRIT